MRMADTNDKKKKKGHGGLTLAIVIAIVSAIVLALVLPHVAMSLEVGGEIFLRLLQMVVVPLVMASVMSGILGLGDVRKLGRPGGAAIAYYMTTTVLAVATGILVVNIIRPGVGINENLVADARQEGGKQVRKAQEAMHGGGQSIEFGHLETAFKSTTSDPVELSSGHDQVAEIVVIQRGDAAKPATVQVETSTDGKTYSPAGERFAAGVKQGKYEFSPLLPHDAKYVRLQYTSQEGEGSSSMIKADLVRGPPTIYDIMHNLVLMLFTSNLLESMVEINLLPLIVFSIVFAGMLTTMGHRSEAIGKLVVNINDALLNFILLLMKVAPIGIFCLVAARFGKAQADGNLIELFKVQFYYMATVLSGLGLHFFITLPVMLYLLTRRNPMRFLMQMSQSVLTAFSTASSTATLPVTMECAEKNAGVSSRSTEFVLPLGATINMDGTALYEAAAAIFIAQAYAMVEPNFELTLVKQFTIAITATLAAIGAAGIPEAGLVTMLIVLNAVGLPLELIGLILPVDWLLDRFRTAVNAYGDAVGSAIVDQTFPSDTPPGAGAVPDAPAPETPSPDAPAVEEPAAETAPDEE